MTGLTDRRQERLEADLERARSDYLAVSRNAHLYANEAAHAEAESRAWERLEGALAAMPEPEASAS